MNTINIEEFNSFIEVATKIGLPFGLYTTSIEGVLLTHNKYFADLLKPTIFKNGETNVIDLFQNPEDRIKRIEWFKNPDNQGKWNVDILFLKNCNEEIILKDACSPIISKDGQTFCFFGLLIDIKNEYLYGRLFENLPIGVYQLDSNNKFVKANKALHEMLKYDDEELIGKDVRDIYIDPKVLDDVTDAIKSDPFYIINQNVELIDKNFKRVWVSLNSYKIPKCGGWYFGREGTAIEKTEEVLRNKLLFNVPVGFYIVQRENDNDLVEHCNDQFAKIFGYNDAKEVIGKNPLVFFNNIAEYKKYIAAIHAADKNKEPLWGHVFIGRKKNGDTFASEINSQFIHDAYDNITGRVGVVRDISRENTLREKINEITSDIGAVMHTYSTVLIQIRNYLEAIIQCNGNDPFNLKKQIDYQETISQVEKYRTVLSKSIDNLVIQLKRKEISINFPEKIIQSICDKSEVLKSLKTEKIEKLKIPLLRYVAYDLNEIIGKKEFTGISRDDLKQIKSNINDVLRISCFIAIHQINDTIVDLERQVRNFREFVTDEQREKPKPTNEDICFLVRHVAFDFMEYANRKNIEIRCNIPEGPIKLFVIKNDIIRALTNILHNAIKYSYSRNTKNSWIQIEVKKDDINLIISFENYGVPIDKEEIVQGFIFKMGYRGIYSGEYGRTGTGFGMNDTYNIVKSCKGELIVDSRPADSFAKQDNYNQPFLTTVSIKLNLINN
ncbi:MAG: PAS domain-containing sensor histidine kinase [Bacteroidia bacterium]|nr:PAS domain-containing sensor histidine kinase [Bacteroidia bacterium]